MFASIIISNHNYGRFLADAIASACGQSYGQCEVIVVDDGSTDGSRQIIETFEGRIRPIFLEHSGQCACLNVGFKASRGDFVLFLDADDILHNDAIADLVRPLVQDDRVVQSQGYLDVVDKSRRRLGRKIPRKLPPSGDYLKRTLVRGPGACQHPYTSGNLWRRSFLENVFPLPEARTAPSDGYLGVDGYLNSVAPLFGHLASVPAVVADYRLHGKNCWHGSASFSADALRSHLHKISYHSDYLSRWSTELGHVADEARWRKWRRNWSDNLAAFTLNLMDTSEPRPRFDEVVLAPFNAGSTHPLKAVGVMALLTVIWCAPKHLSQRWSRRLLERKLAHLAQGGS